MIDLPLSLVQDVLLHLTALELLQVRGTCKFLHEVCVGVAETIVIRLANQYYPHMIEYDSKTKRTVIKRGVFAHSIYLLLRELSTHQVIIVRGFIAYSFKLSKSRPHFRRCCDTRRDRKNFSFIFFKGEMYVIGTSSLVAAGTVEKYNLVTQSWVNVASLPRKFRSVTAVVVKTGDKQACNDSLYVFGGFDMLSSNLSDEIYLFVEQVEKETWVLQETKLLYPRVNSSVVTYKNRIWISGGTLETGKAINTVEIYDVATGLIVMGPPMVRMRHHHNMMYVCGRLYSVGGDEDEAGNRLRRTIEVLVDNSDGDNSDGTDDFQSCHWEHVAAFKDERIGFCSTSVLSNIYIFSGSFKGEFHEQQLDTWDCFNVDTGVWESDLSNQVEKVMPPMIDSWGQCMSAPTEDDITWSNWD